MKHLFLPYKLALLAKEKGFDEECIGIHPNTIDGVYIHQTCIKSEYLRSFGYSQKAILAPLYQQIIDWFREKKHLWITVELGNHMDAEWKIQELHVHNGKTIVEGIEYYYPEALNKAIEEAFKLI